MNKKANCLLCSALLFVLITFISVSVAEAATTPSLGQADVYGVLSSTYTDTSSSTVINGSVGFTTPPATAPGGTHTYYGSGAPYSTAGTDQGSALTSLAAQPCTYTFPSGAINLSTDTTHGTAGIYTPGVYCSAGAMTIGGPLSLSGNGTYIFRSAAALDSSAGAIVSVTGGASACDVFWTPTSATTLGANTTFLGTVIADSGISVGANSTWLGRALSFGGTVTTDTNTITVPTCLPNGTLRVSKTVINDNGGASSAGSFMLYVKNSGVNVSNSPIAGVAAAGTAYSLSPGTYVVSEDAVSSYGATYSGACDSSGTVILTSGSDVTCTVTNNDISTGSTSGGSSSSVPPLIDLVKVPSPLALPNGPGLVTYTYTVKNIGPVPMTNVTVVDDLCISPVYRSGDLNNDTILGTTESWTYTCVSNISKTTTNIATAVGYRYGQSATDQATATVVVGASVLPPIIHVTKVPSSLYLPFRGSVVTYVEVISNPGNVPLSNVKISDDKCAPVNYISGDINRNAILDTNEYWTYNCRTVLSETTTNIASVSGKANGITARDTSVAMVIVGSGLPIFPNTGFSNLSSLVWMIVSALILTLILGSIYLKSKQYRYNK